MEEKIIINEAEGFNPGDNLLTGELIPTSSSDTRWNDLFKKYLNPDSTKFYFIKVEGFNRKTPIEGEPNRGFIKFTGKTESTQSKKFLVFGGDFRDTLNSEDIKIVEREDEATVFKGQDVQIIIDAVQRNKDFNLKNARFSRVDVSDEILAGMNISNQLMMAYFGLLCDDERAGDRLRSALSMLNTICRPRNNPLVGNPLFDVLSAIVKQNPSFNINPTSVLTLNNLMSERIIKAGDIINPPSLLGSLCYNNNLYKYRVKQIDSIFDAYDKARTLDGDITLPGLTSLGTTQKEIKRQFARNLVLIASDEDPLVAMVEGKAGEDETLPTIGYKPEGIVLTAQIRSPESCDNIINAVLGSSEREERDVSRIVFTLKEGDTEKKSEILSDEEDEFVIGFKAVEFKKGDFITLTVGDKKDQNLLIDLIKNNYFKDSTDFTTDDNKLIANKDQKSNVSITVDKTNGYKATEMKLVDSSTTVAPEKTEEPKEEEKPESTPTPAEVIKPGELFAGKTIDEIAAMTRDEFRAFKSALSSEEATRLKSFGGRFLGI